MTIISLEYLNANKFSTLEQQTIFWLIEVQVKPKYPSPAPVNTLIPKKSIHEQQNDLLRLYGEEALKLFLPLRKEGIGENPFSLEPSKKKQKTNQQAPSNSNPHSTVFRDITNIPTSSNQNNNNNNSGVTEKPAAARLLVFSN